MLWQELHHILVITKDDSSAVPLFTGQLSYRPLIRTFCPTQSNHLINKLQEQALRVTYSHYGSSFSELPEMANESTIHRKKIKVLMTEIYKFLNGLSPPIMNDIFKKHYCTLRNLRSLVSKCKFSATYGIVLSLSEDHKFGKIFLKALKILTH